MDTYVDASYGQFLDDVFGGDGTDFSRYMMPVSPVSIGIFGPFNPLQYLNIPF
jgi:hypothetical protein